MRSVLPAMLLLLSCTPALTAQLQIRPLDAPLRPYATCKLAGGPDLVEITPLVAKNSIRTVQTLHGDAHVKLVDGARLMFAYPDTDSFANVRVEELPAASYDKGKADLISNFDKLLSADDNATRNYSLKPTMQGFDIYGMDRKTLDGNNLGIYLFFDNKTHVAATAYLLNADPARRKFATMDEYTGYRDQFLERYLACVRSKMTTPTAPAAAPAAKH